MQHRFGLCRVPVRSHRLSEEPVTMMQLGRDRGRGLPMPLELGDGCLNERWSLHGWLVRLRFAPPELTKLHVRAAVGRVTVDVEIARAAHERLQRHAPALLERAQRRPGKACRALRLVGNSWQ